MKVRINVSKEAAVKAGSNFTGVMVVDLDVSQLNEIQRAELLKWSYSRGSEGGVADFDLTVCLGLSSGWERQIAKEFVDISQEGIAELLTKLAERRVTAATEEEAKAKDKAAEDAEKQRVAAEKIEAAFAVLSVMTPEERFLDATIPLTDDEHRSLRYQHPLMGDPVNWPQSHRVPSMLRPMLTEVQTRLKEWNEAVDEKEHQAKLDWVTQHGSNRLRRMFEEEIECENVYRDERLVVERPGWVYACNVDLELDDPRNVPEEAFELLDAARVLEPEAWLQYSKGYDDNGCRVDRYVAVAEHQDNLIIFGIQSPVVEAA